MSANNIQVAGNHYRAKVQHWDYAIHALNNRYLEGNITKYVVRHRKKNGAVDLAKAIHYMDKLVESFNAGEVTYHVTTDLNFDIHSFIVENGLNTVEAFVVKRLAHWTTVEHLEQARDAIVTLLQEQHDRDRRIDAIKAGAVDNAPVYEEPGKGYVNQDR